MRQQLAPGQQVHGIVSEGGQVANVIPARTELQYTMRATDASSLADLEAKVGNCFRAGAVATGCEYSVEQTEPMYDALKPDAWLAETVRAEMTRLGRSPVGRELEVALPLGSTDMGNVTQFLPGIHPMVGVDAGGASLHQPDFAAAAIGPSADKAVIEGAIMLARTVVRLAESSEERDRVLTARDRRAAS
jgi:metal-dependent amidase/aminoacylase/carboxypeptidase family protein